MEAQIISSGLYIIHNKINCDKYIGVSKKSVFSRFKSHITDSKNIKKSTRLIRAIRKYGHENFYVELLVISDNSEYLKDLEKKAIILYNTKSPNGYNLTDGGDGVVGKTQETIDKIKISRNLSNPVLTDEGRKKLSETTFNYWQDAELKVLRSNLIKISLNKPETKKKQKENIKKYCNSEEGKLQKSKTAKILWQNEEYADLVRHKVKVAKNDPLRKEIRSNGAKLSHVTRRKNKELNNAN